MNALIYLLSTSAGIGFFCAVLLDWINEWLYKRNISVISLEDAFTALLRTQKPAVAEREGLVTMLFAGWFATLGFMLLWLTPWYQQASRNVFVGALVYAVVAWLVLMFLLLPLLHAGVLARRHHERASSSVAVLLLFYAIMLSILVPLVF